MSSIADSALYIRQRVIRLHELNRMLYPKRKWMAMMKCVLAQTEPMPFASLAKRLLLPTFTEQAARDAEFALVGHYGHERYANEVLLRRHVMDTLVRFRVGLVMHEIYQGCGADVINKPEDIMESAAWHAGNDSHPEQV